MKVFLDRLGFIFHRPRFFGKTFTSIVVQGVYGGNKISGYFNFIGKGLGFEVVKGCCLNSMEPMTEKNQKVFDEKIKRLSIKFWSSLNKKEYPAPTLFELMDSGCFIFTPGKNYHHTCQTKNDPSKNNIDNDRNKTVIHRCH